MLRVNLNALLAERNITASRLSKETGISKTTLTSLVNNTGKGIQYDTIDTICNYLGVTPNDFFDYVSIDYIFDYETLYFNTDSELLMPGGRLEYLNSIRYEFEFIVDIKTRVRNEPYYFIGHLEIDDASNMSFSSESLIIDLEFKNSEDAEKFKVNFYNRISAGHKGMFNKEVKEFIEEKFQEEFNKAMEQKGYDDSFISVEGVSVYVMPWEDLPF